MSNPEYRLDKQQVRRAFDRAASSYEQSAVLQREVVGRMLDRLEYIRIKPECIVDVGAGTGFVGAGLAKHYPKATVYELDMSIRMLQQIRQKQAWYKRWFGKQTLICADAEQLPLQDKSADIIFSSLVIQWCDNLEETFAEFFRVLKPGGLLMFTTFGPDTLIELRQSWAQVDDEGHVSQFMDMHDVGDALLRAGMAEPVMDVENFTLMYEKVADLLHDLKAIGATNALQKRNRGLTGKQAYQAMQTHYETLRQTDQGKLPATYEVVYGHAWKSPDSSQDNSVAVELKERL